MSEHESLTAAVVKDGQVAFAAALQMIREHDYRVSEELLTAMQVQYDSLVKLALLYA